MLVEFFLTICCFSYVTAGTFNAGTYLINYDTTSGVFDVLFNNQTVISNAYASVKNGNTFLNSTSYTTFTTSQANFDDQFGSGIVYSVVATGNNFPTMQQNFYTYSGKNFFLTEVYLNGSGLSSHYMAPLVTNNANIQTTGDVRSLFVPFDNDDWIRYDSKSLTMSTSVTSSEVSAIFDNNSRKGVIVGSVEHDTWKTGVKSTGNSDGTMQELTIWGGYTDFHVTRDNLTHGSISGSSIKSPKIFIGLYPDWRRGLEEYAQVQGDNMNLHL